MTPNKESERKQIDLKDVNKFVNGLNDYRDNWMTEINGKDYLTPTQKIEGNKKVNKYVPPIVYYNTSNPYATTYYANGYEYVPNYIPPVVYYASTYGYYGGGISYSRGYGYSSGGGYSNSNGTYYPNYVPQSAYYTKEAQLVAEERGYGGELPGGGDNDNWLEGELGSQSIGISGAIGWAKYGPELAGASDFAGGIGGGFLTAGVELATGHDIYDALGKGFAVAGAALTVGTLAAGIFALAVPAAGVLAVAAVGIGVTTGLSMLYDGLYDLMHGKKKKKK